MGQSTTIYNCCCQHKAGPVQLRSKNTPVFFLNGLYLALLIMICAPVLAANADKSLSLSEAESLAVSQDPVIAASRATARALDAAAVADGQLADPKIKAGLFNLPLDNLEIDREPTTQLRLGLQQAFPRGRTRYFSQQKTQWLATAEQAITEDKQRRVIRDVRNRFLELYYQIRAAGVIEETRALFAQLVDITQAHYATGRVSQQDVLRASLELSRLDDRATRVRNEEDKSRAMLMKWIGEAASRPLSNYFPDLPELPEKDVIAGRLQDHPLIKAESARIESFNQGVQISRQQYKPGFNVGLEYRKRFGNNPGGDNRADMMAAMVTMDLPLFPKNRQDKRLVASVRQAEAAQLKRADRLRELKAMLDSDYASWQRLDERAQLYNARLLREASANTSASLSAYQAGVTEFTTLMRARITDLDVRLDDLRIRVDRAKTQARLLYLAGENS